MPRKFIRRYDVRYDDCTLHPFLTPAAALRYMQDIASLDAADSPLPDNSVWVARRTVLEFHKPVPVRAEVEITTFPMGFTKVTALRAYDLRISGEENPAVQGRTLWVYLDERGRPRRMPDVVEKFWLPEGNLGQRAEAPFPAVPESEPENYAFCVPLSYLDVMAHVNNTKYVELLDDAIWEGLKKYGATLNSALTPVYYDIEYLESATLGENLTVQSWFASTPTTGTTFGVIQQIKRGTTNLIRAHSRWQWEN
jgi:acyl-CoA thioesterase FadM